jgi:hypothetical protein
MHGLLVTGREGVDGEPESALGRSQADRRVTQAQFMSGSNQPAAEKQARV